jgi:hypothetical protein
MDRSTQLFGVNARKVAAGQFGRVLDEEALRPAVHLQHVAVELVVASVAGELLDV